jgi:predicted ester cyclase
MSPKDFIKTWFANIDAKNFEGLKKQIDKDHKFTNPMTPEPIGSDQHLGMIQQMTSSFSGKHLVDQVINEGDWVTARGQWSGKHAGEFNGIPATGKQVDFSWIDIMHVVNGKVVEEYFEMNPLVIMQQIGGEQN